MARKSEEVDLKTYFSSHFHLNTHYENLHKQLTNPKHSKITLKKKKNQPNKNKYIIIKAKWCEEITVNQKTFQCGL